MVFNLNQFIEDILVAYDDVLCHPSVFQCGIIDLTPNPY